MSGFFITGTDTGVGKTFVTCALLQALQDRGLRVAPMKPIAAGGSMPAAGGSIPAAGDAIPVAGTIDADGGAINEDVAAFARLSGHRYSLRAMNPYCFRDAIAPHIAAQREQRAVDMAVIQAAYRTLVEQADIVLVEGAGGFLAPMSETESMALIPAALQLPVIVVVGMRLGCLNHALLTVEAIRSRGLALAGWIANTPGETMNAHAENLSTLQRMIPAPMLGEIPNMPRVDVLANSRQAAAHLQLQSLMPATARR